MAGASWYWNRLKAMSASEVSHRARKKQWELLDARRTWTNPPFALVPQRFPVLPPRESAPEAVRLALAADARRILAGRWEAFENLSLQVDDPPRWHRDYLVGRDLPTMRSGFRLDHRRLPDGADVKLIWELSRWHELVRLAMAAYVLHDRRAGGKCLAWLEDWAMHNPPYRGWNWTSALEVGIRLIQFVWIDALLAGWAATADGGEAERARELAVGARLARLRAQVLAPHVWYAWRHQSFGSSANNHLLGELAGCILALARWPDLARVGVPMNELQAAWEREVLAQFHQDGGNKEQALNYHLFSFELCWQAYKALEAAVRHPAAAVRDRLDMAGAFFRQVQVPTDPWDYGDSDGAYVTPFFAEQAIPEWHCWFEDPAASPALSYWLGPPPSGPCPGEQAAPDPATRPAWRVYRSSGIAVRRTGPWALRWDLSPLGHLSTAAHGHLDALHVSVWYDGVAFVVDPGTGAYFADPRVRAALASRSAHNGPCPAGQQRPARLGPFLWETHHAVPEFDLGENLGTAALDLWGTRIGRRITVARGGVGFDVKDSCTDRAGHPKAFSVRWQFAPQTSIVPRADRAFEVRRGGVGILVAVSPAWSAVSVGEGLVAPGFRNVRAAPFLELTSAPGSATAGPLQTTFALGGHL